MSNTTKDAPHQVTGSSKKVVDKQHKEKKLRRKWKSTTDLLRFNTQPANGDNDQKNDSSSDSGDDAKVMSGEWAGMMLRY